MLLLHTVSRHDKPTQSHDAFTFSLCVTLVLVCFRITIPLVAHRQSLLCPAASSHTHLVSKGTPFVVLKVGRTGAIGGTVGERAAR